MADVEKAAFVRGQWDALDKVLNHINTMGEVGEKFRQRLYQDVVAMRPVGPLEEQCGHCHKMILKGHTCAMPIQWKNCPWHP